MSKHELSLVEVTHYTDPEVLAIVKDFHVRGNFALMNPLMIFIKIIKLR